MQDLKNRFKTANRVFSDHQTVMSHPNTWFFHGAFYTCRQRTNRFFSASCQS